VLRALQLIEPGAWSSTPSSGSPAITASASLTFSPRVGRVWRGRDAEQPGQAGFEIVLP
jgi:hypothetical protein